MLDFPPIPRVWSQMKVPKQIKTTVDNQLFWIMEEKISGKDDIVWGFASAFRLEVMKIADAFYGDGTFEMVKDTKFG